MSLSQPEIRVFISSTFRDLQAEREYLMKKIFPELRDLSHKRGVEFTEIDLRWGIPEEDAERGSIIRVCLDEIDRCRPFFIGILGSRYGTAPQFQSVEIIEAMKRDYPWIEDALRDRMSVTEMEILHGVLLNPDQAELAHFYFRDANLAELARDETHYDESVENHRRLERLKDRIRHSGVAVREGFQNIETLGALVRADLLRLINMKYPPEQDVQLQGTPLAHLRTERLLHQAFAMTRRRAYVPTPGVIERLYEHAEGEGDPLVLHGESGSGKSSLISYWLANYTSEHPEAFVIAHYVGTYTSRREDVMRHILEEIKARHNIEEEIPTNDDGLLDAFPIWLAKAQGSDTDTTVILAIDAINQLDELGREMTWLPQYIPPFVRLILSTTDGTSYDALRARGWPTLELTPLTSDDRAAIITLYFEQYRKRLTRKQLVRVADEEKNASPLFLRTVLEELRLFGSHERLDDHIELLLGSQNIDDLFQQVLARMEQDYGPSIIERIMTRLWASRRGLTETELLGACNITRLDLSIVLHALEFHLIDRSGKLNFFHDYLRRAVERRYLHTADAQQASHRKLAEYFASQKLDDRRLEEEPWQWMKAEAWEKFASALTTTDIFLAMNTEQNKYQLMRYWLAIGERADVVEEYMAMLDSFEITANDPLARAKLQNGIGTFFHLASRFEPAEDLMRRALETRRAHLGAEHAMTAETLNDLGDLLQARGRYAEAETYLQDLLEIREHLFGSDHTETAKALDSLGALFYYQGKYREAEASFTRARAIYERELGPTNTLTLGSTSNLGAALDALGRYDEALTLFQATLEAAEFRFGPTCPLVADLLSNVANEYRAKGQPNAALSVMERSVAIYRRNFGEGSTVTLNAMQNFGVLLWKCERLNEAKEIYEAVIAKLRQFHGNSPPKLAILITNLAAVLEDLGQTENSERVSREAVEISVAALGPHHPRTLSNQLNLAFLLQKHGKLADAEGLYSTYIPLKERLLGISHPEVLLSLNNFSMLLDAEGKQEEAAAVRERIESAKT